jgi:hypothetical protein
MGSFDRRLARLKSRLPSPVANEGPPFTPVQRAKVTLAVLRRVGGSHDLPLPPRLPGLMMHFEAADAVGPPEQAEEAAIEFFDEFKTWWDTEVRPMA